MAPGAVQCAMIPPVQPPPIDPNHPRPASRAPLVAVGLLGFYSGLPLALSGSTLQAWLTVSGADLATIGLLSLVGWPYLLKFLWAPALDRWHWGGLGRRRCWLVLLQWLLAVVLGACAWCEPSRAVWPLAVLALALAALSATQDIAIDAYRTEILPSAARGLGTGYAIAGYRLAMFVSGAGALLLADVWGFRATYGCLAGLMLVGSVVSLRIAEPPLEPLSPVTLRAAIVEPLRALAQRPGIVPVLLFIALYKFGDQFAASLTQTFFIRGQGFSLTEIGTIYKGVGIGAALLGGIVGGLAMYRLGLWQALLGFGLLQALTNVGFLLLAVGGKSLVGLVLVVVLENLSGGMGTCAHVALIMALCERRYTATQFAALTAFASAGRVLLGPLAGWVAEAGWVTYFGFSCLLAVPALVLLLRLRAVIAALDQPAEPTPAGPNG